MDDCLFCKIISGEIPSTVVYQDDDTISIRDINPQTPTHVLVMPRKHFKNLTEAAEADPELVGRLMRACAKVARQEGVAEDGHRGRPNIGVHGAQTDQHLHLHVMGGVKLSEQMA